MPNGVDHEFTHRKLTKFLKKIYQLGVKKERQIEKSISTIKHVVRKQAKKSAQWQILAISYRKKKKKRCVGAEGAGGTQRQNQDSTRWSQKLWQTAHREWD